MHYDRSCFLSRCVTSIQKIVSHKRSALREGLVQIARCVYVTRNAIWTWKILRNNLAIVLQYYAWCIYVVFSWNREE